jgi:hypothetical protein
MFAIQSNKSKGSTKVTPQQGGASLSRKAEIKVNPVWQSLALGTTGLQAKLAISAPSDPYEQEADRVADRVMRMAEPQPNNSTTSSVTRELQRKCSPCEDEEEKKVQRKERTQPAESPANAPATVHEALSSPGQALDPITLSSMENRFGRDFSDVRVHSGAAAEQSAQDVNAHAYTVGHDIVFAPGRFALGSPEGKRLLAHELTHVVQQGGRGSAGMNQGVLHRQNAQAAANRANGCAGQVIVSESPGLGIARTPLDLTATNETLDLSDWENRSPDLTIWSDDKLLAKLEEIERSRGNQQSSSSKPTAADTAYSELRDELVRRAVEALASTEQDEETTDGSDAETPSFIPTTLSLLPETIGPFQFTDEDIEALAPSTPKLPTNPEDPDYWYNWDEQLLPIHIGNETKRVRHWEFETIEEGVGDQGDKRDWVNRSYWDMTRPVLRAYLVHMVGNLTPWEEKLVSGEVRAEHGVSLVASETAIIGYYVKSQDANESGITIESVHDRFGKLLQSRTTGGDVISEGIGPLVLLLPGVAAGLGRGAVSFARGAANLGRAALARSGTLLRPLTVAARIRTAKMMEGLVEADRVAFGGAPSSGMVLAEGRAAATSVSRAGAQAATRTAVQSTEAQAVAGSSARGVAQTSRQAAPAGAQSAGGARVSGVSAAAVRPASTARQRGIPQTGSAGNPRGSSQARADRETPAPQPGPWRGKVQIQTGDSREGWVHIEAGHITGTDPGGDLFAPGTTRAQLQRAAEIVVSRGMRISDPGRRMQTFERRITVNGKSDNVRVRLDSRDGRVITIFPVRGGV